jgi:hypothetical protein
MKGTIARCALDKVVQLYQDSYLIKQEGVFECVEIRLVGRPRNRTDLFLPSMSCTFLHMAELLIMVISRQS